jgi:putative transposase
VADHVRRHLQQDDHWWAISERGDAGTVLCALRSALLVDPAQGPHGGVPVVIEYDHGADFLSAAVARVAASLVTEVRPVMIRDGRGKGKIERWHQTVAQMLLTQTPGFTDGPRTKSGRLYGPVRDDAAWLDGVAAADRASATAGRGGADILTLPQLCRLFTAWARWFNTEHEHEGLHRRTPLQAWDGDPSEISVLDPERLRDLLLVTDDVAITSKGIRRNNLHYVADEIRGMVGDPGYDPLRPARRPVPRGLHPRRPAPWWSTRPSA